MADNLPENLLITAVNRGLRLVLTTDGRFLPISDYLDSDGEETDNPEEAVIAIVNAGDSWAVLDLRDFERESTQ